MWKNYLTVGIRALAKNKTYALINIFGLAIGMAACLMILLFVRYEMSYDKWIPERERIYQFQSWYKSNDTGEENKLQMTPWIAGERLKKDFPQVERAVYAFGTEPVFIKDGQAQTVEDFIYADGDFLSVIPLPLARGNPNALSQLNTVVLTQSEARRLYGTEDVIGRTHSVISRGITRDFRITGILKDLPKNSHLEISTIARIDYAQFNADTPQAMECWGCQNGWVWVKLKPGTDPKVIQAALPAWEKRNIPDEAVGEGRFNRGDEQDWH
ncbi:MAG: ABC transporter permease, partial [Pseudomonadota bacterium]|nr:ABC transporter permease [Pseudomonadota bacterium]